MAKQQKRSQGEPDSVYLLKIVLYFILGSFWIQLSGLSVAGSKSMLVPAGLVIGLLLASRDRFKIDRKIEYVVLLAAAVLSFLGPTGFTLSF